MSERKVVIIMAVMTIMVILPSCAISPINLSFDSTILDSCGIITYGYGYGSCVAIEPNLILTAGHCIDHAGAYIQIGGIQYDIIDQWKSDDHDVGFVRINGNLPYIEFGKMPELLDEVYIIGTPREPKFLNFITKGVICKLNLVESPPYIDWENNFICDAMAWRGNSGGPVLNKYGYIIGIYVGLFPDVDNFSVCVPVRDIKAALEEYCNSI